MKKIVHLVNISRRPLFRASSKLMTNIFTVSRLKYKPDLVPLHSVCPIPQMPTHFNKSFDEVAMARAEALWKTYKSEVNVLWSGGIDSTAALTALIQTRPTGGKINVYCNLHSMLENRHFYQLLLKSDFINFKNSSVMQSERPVSIITGEHGDQVFGSDFIFQIANIFGVEAIHRPYEEIIPELYGRRGGEIEGKILYEKYRPIVDEAPFKIKTAFDFVWWWNFTQKWQCIKFHQHSLLHPSFETIHFYEYDDFQFWSMSNHHLKIGNTLESYKGPSKSFIHKFDKNDAYFQNKKKLASPLGNHRYFYVLFEDGTKIDNYHDCHNLIEELSCHS